MLWRTGIGSRALEAKVRVRILLRLSRVAQSCPERRAMQVGIRIFVEEILLPKHGSILDVIIVLIGWRQYAVGSVHCLVSIIQLIIATLTDFCVCNHIILLLTILTLIFRLPE